MPPLDPHLAAVIVAEGRDGRDRRRDVLGGHDDVQVDDGLSGQAGHARAAHVLDAVPEMRGGVTKSSDVFFRFEIFLSQILQVA